MDVLNLVAALHDRLGVDIPEDDYVLIETPAKAASYLATPVKLEATAGASGGSAGIDGEVEAYYDRQTEEAHLGLGGELAALLGLGVDLHLTIGGKGEEAGETGDAGPNVIVAGAGTVLVGD